MLKKSAKSWHDKWHVEWSAVMLCRFQQEKGRGLGAKETRDEQFPARLPVDVNNSYPLLYILSLYCSSSPLVLPATPPATPDILRLQDCLNEIRSKICPSKAPEESLRSRRRSFVKPSQRPKSMREAVFQQRNVHWWNSLVSVCDYYHLATTSLWAFTKWRWHRTANGIRTVLFIVVLFVLTMFPN